MLGSKRRLGRKVLGIVLLGSTFLTGVELLGAPAAQALPSGYGYSREDVMCNVSMTSGGQIYERSIIPQTPVMWAPATMRVSWQPILFRWDGSAWVRDVVGPELKGSTYYGLPDSVGFTINVVPRYYRVAVRYRWYWNGAVYQSAYTWAGTHVQQFFKDLPSGGFSMWQGDTGNYCKVA
jgi:hypothetical protein